MTCSRCITLEAERDWYAQALARANEEALATERDRDRLREAARAFLYTWEVGEGKILGPEEIEEIGRAHV